FSTKVQQCIEQTKPDLIICTHALPSYILECLKKRNLWSGPVINVYTDYFINNLWGKEGINYHFVPSPHAKRELLNRGIKPQQTFVTGVPIHPLFKPEKRPPIKKSRFTVLISGGNMGAGSIQQLLDRLHPSCSILYNVLSGKNKKLLQSIERLNNKHIIQIPFISYKEEI